MLVAGVCGSVGTPAAAAAKTTPGVRVSPAGAPVNGKTPAQWLEAGLRARIAASKRSLRSKNCSERPQPDPSGRVVLLPGDAGKTLTCTVGPDAVVLVDTTGAICNESKKRRLEPGCVEERLTQIRDYRVSVDGRAIDASAYQTVTAAFTVEAKKGNAFGLVPGNWKLQAGGWPVFLSGLSVGEHRVVTSYRIANGKTQTITVVVNVVK
jgi:hypothetical protein